MKAKEYDVLVMAIADGVSAGWRRAHKHVDAPDEADIRAQIELDVLGAICEWFDFDASSEEE